MRKSLLDRYVSFPPTNVVLIASVSSSLVRFLPLLLLASLITACNPSGPDASRTGGTYTDTLSRHEDGSPKTVSVLRGDSVIERRTYRPSGRVSKVVRGDSVQTYLDLHNPDSAAVLKDYLQGRWRNLSADTSRKGASAYYVFDSDRLTFQNPSRTALESLTVTYEDNRRLVTKKGMAVRPEISSFDTVRVTGYLLVRSPPADSL